MPEALVLSRILVTIIFFIMICGVQCIKCSYIIKVGSTYRLQCSHFDEKEPVTAHNLVLRQYDSKRIIPSTQYLIVDNRTIELVWENIPRINTQIECYYRDEKNNINRGVFIKNVRSETPPEKIKNFQCITYDFQYLQCSFEKTEQYQTETIISPSECEQIEKNVCKLSQPSYDSAKRHYNFTIFSKNCFGETKQSFSINDLENVIPGKPNISMTSIRPNSAVLSLTMHNELYKEKGLTYEIKLWRKSADPISLNTSELDPNDLHHLFPIKHLKAFRNYKIEVRAQSRDNKIVGSDMWSPVAEVLFKTLAKAPDRPPKIDVGSFYIDSEHQIHIFWGTVQESEHNGNNFRYEIFEVRRNGKEIREARNNYSFFWNNFTTTYKLPRGNYEFSVRSINDNGTSPAVVLNVPELAYPGPRKVRSIYKNGNYIVCWNPPQTDLTLQNYTVFNCVSASPNDAANKCSENFRFAGVPIDTKCMNFTSEKSPQFAVSANYNDGSSGMVWIDCIASFESDVGVVSLISQSVKNSSTITLEWRLNCIQKSLVTGYTIMYCRKLLDVDDCHNKIINADAETADLTGLSPYTEYDIRIAISSEARSGHFGKSVMAKTSEGVSTAPRNLVLCNVTRNIMYLKWERPEELNGQLRYYKVWFNNERVEISGPDYLNASVSYTLANLKYNQAYNISVVAGTKSDSAHSNVIRTRTGASDPGTASIVRFESIFSNSYKIIWQSDNKTFSPVKGYEIKIENSSNNQSWNRVVNFGETYLEETFNCSQETEKYEVYIRTLSVDMEIFMKECSAEPFDMFQTIAHFKLTDIFAAIIAREDTSARIMYGNWSAPVWYTCKIASSSLVQVATSVTCLVIFVVALLLSIWYARRRIVLAKNIFIILPPGLLLYDVGTETDSPAKDSILTSSAAEMLTAAKYEETSHLFNDFNDEKDNRLDAEYGCNRSTFGSVTSVVKQLEELRIGEENSEPSYVPMQNNRKVPVVYVPQNAFDSKGVPLKRSETTFKDNERKPIDIHTQNLKHLDSNGYLSLRDMEKLQMMQKPSNEIDSIELENCLKTNGYITHHAFNANGTLKRSIEIEMSDFPMSHSAPLNKFDSYGYMRAGTSNENDSRDGNMPRSSPKSRYLRITKDAYLSRLPHHSKLLPCSSRIRATKSLPSQNKSSMADSLPLNIFDSKGYLLHDAANKITKVESVSIPPTLSSCSRGMQSEKSETFDPSGYITKRKSTPNKDNGPDSVSEKMLANGGYVSPALFQKMTNQSLD